MKTLFVNSLSPQQLSDVMSIYYGTTVVSIEQYPGFAQAYDPASPVWYLLVYRDQSMIGYACVRVKKRIIALILHGPLVADTADYEEVCAALVAACAKRGVLVIRIFPPYMDAERAAAIKNFSKIKMEQSDAEFNWATLKLSLDKPLEELLKGFSENHRRNIKKAQKLNLTTSEITEAKDIDTFSEQYVRMYESRNLPISLEQTRQSFQNVFTHFRENKNGIFLAVRSDTDGVIGGLCISYQSNAAFYFKGYSHPDHRNMPINHIAFYEAIKLAQEKGIKYFDFGGYGLNLAADSPVHAINRFKEGFAGDQVVYPQTLTIYTTPFSKMLYHLYRRIRKTES